MRSCGSRSRCDGSVSSILREMVRTVRLDAPSCSRLLIGASRRTLRALITAERDGYCSWSQSSAACRQTTGLACGSGLNAVDRGPLALRAFEGSALGFEREAAAALHAAVAAAMVARVANLQARLVVFFRDRLAAVGHEVGQRSGQVPGLTCQRRQLLGWRIRTAEWGACDGRRLPTLDAILSCQTRDTIASCHFCRQRPFQGLTRWRSVPRGRWGGWLDTEIGAWSVSGMGMLLGVKTWKRVGRVSSVGCVLTHHRERSLLIGASRRTLRALVTAERDGCYAGRARKRARRWLLPVASPSDTGRRLIPAWQTIRRPLSRAATSDRSPSKPQQARLF